MVRLKWRDIFVWVCVAVGVLLIMSNSNTEYINEFDLETLELVAGNFTENGYYIDENTGFTGTVLSTGNLSLGPSTYDLSLKYTSVGQPVTVCIQTSDGTSADTKLSYPLSEGYKVETIKFSTGAKDKYINIQFEYETPGSFELVAMVLYARHAYRDDIALSVLLIASVIIVYILLRRKTQGKVTDRLIDGILVFLVALFVTYGSFTFNLRFGHDNYFHLSRIESVRDQILAGVFPSRVYVTAYKGYGYAAPTFYPDLFLYLPAFLRILGMSQSFCYGVLFFVANLIAGYAMYYAANLIFRKREISLTSSVLYLTALYRLTDIICRAAVGEAYAMSFLPLIIGGMYCLLVGEYKYWWVLTLGITGVLQSHVLSTMMAAMFCALAVLIFIPKFVMDKKRILFTLKALAVAVIINLWFLVPFAQSFASTKLQTNNIATTFWLFSQPISEMLVFFPRFFNGVYAGGGYYAAEALYGLGATITLLCIAFPIIWFNGKKERKDDKTTAVLIGLGLLAVWMSTDLFPWKTVCGVPYIGPIFSMIQFPWRFMSIATPLTALAAGYTADISAEDLSVNKNSVIAVLCIIALLSGGVYIGSVFTSGTLMPNMVPIINGIDQYLEYLPVGIGHDWVLQRGDYIEMNSGNVIEYDRDNKLYEFTYEKTGEDSYAILPLIYYSGYQARDSNGNRLEVTSTEEQLLKVRLIDTSGTVKITYGKTLWMICDWISFLSVIAITVINIRKKKRQRQE